MARKIQIRSTPANSPVEFDSHGDCTTENVGFDWWKPSVEKWAAPRQSFDWSKAQNLAVTFVGDDPHGVALYVVSFSYPAPWGQSLPHVYFVSRR